MSGLRQAVDTIFERRLREAPDREIEPAARWWHVRRHGSFALAYGAAVEPYLKSFGDERGFIAYGQKMGYIFALGDPLAAPQHHEGLIDDFIAAFGKPAFVQTSQATARLLAARGYRINQMGIETELDLSTYSFAGKHGESIRYASNWLRNNGYSIRECAPGELPSEEIAALSRRWRRTRRVGKREVHFLNRPFWLEPTADLRRFFLFDPQGKAVAFVSFDPLYRDDAVIGYVSSNKRREPDAPSYAELGITRHAVETFQKDGLEVVQLGLSPFAYIEKGPMRDDALLRRFMQHAFRSRLVNRKIYNLEGLAAFKRRFRGRELPVYFATPGTSNFVRLIALLRLCRVI